MEKRQKGAPLIDTAEPEEHQYEYDLLVIGGGSGGIAAAKEAAEFFDKKVAVCDFVVPSPKGTSWGLGGTCVNVGCIPKKLYHTSALLRENIEAAKAYGWEIGENPEIKLNWQTLVQGIQDHIGSLNWGYRVQLRERKITYLNAFATFVDAHTVKTVTKQQKEQIVTARRIIVATGGRPTIPDIPGKEFAITSDDIFALWEGPPGKTLVVGGSYVALECAGYLNGMGFDTTVMPRSILLRGFDQQLAEMIKKSLLLRKLKFIQPAVPSKIEKLESGRLRVTYHRQGAEEAEEFDTVMFATGRDSQVPKIEPAKAGLQLAANGKVPVDEFERTNVPHIYALGDCREGGLELTPVAIQAGKLLVHRLYGGKTQGMDYVNVPTTVFTPLEYGCIGLSEERAEELYGKDNIEVYHGFFTPLEHTVTHSEDECYYKLITHLRDNERLLGFHYLGPNAGEVTQGYGLGFKLGATKADLDSLVGIHPTCAEEFTTYKVNVTKRSGKEAKKTGC